MPRFPADLRLGLLCWLATALPVVAAVLLVWAFGRPTRESPTTPPLATLFARWDGQEYRKVVESGYDFERGHLGTSVAFFPALPLLAHLLTFTGLSAEWALVAVANVAAAAAFVAAAAYVRRRFPEGDPAPVWVLLALGLLPNTYFFRMAYSESLFLLVTVLVLYALEADWPPVVAALLVGLATAVRPVGVALAVPFAVHVWRRAGPWRLAALAPLTVWGLAAFMLYQWWRFDDPLAFAYSQSQWRYRPGLPHLMPPDPLWRKVLGLVTLEPFWFNFVAARPFDVKTQDPAWAGSPVFSGYLANPILFALAVLTVGYGAARRWLTWSEGLAAASLLLIPYVTRSYEILMASGGRFAVVVFPVYLVVGRLLGRLPRRLAGILLALSALMLMAYAAKFALKHPYTY